MRTRFKICTIIFILAFFCGCSSPRSGGGDASGQESYRAFPPLKIPSVYTEPSERVEYALMHFWDSFLSTSQTFPCDSLRINGVAAGDVEQQMASFASICQGADPTLARKAAATLFSKVEALQTADTLSNVYDRFADLAKKYFYDPNSPFRDEDVYREYLLGLSSSPFTPETLRPSYENDARLCALNAVGTPAADFRFVDASGRSHTLYGVKAPYTLLFFSNPGCEACKDIIDVLSTDLRIQYLQSEGRLAVVNVYIDEDIAAWRDYLDHYPSSWYNGYDPTYSIREDLSYHVRAIPSLYLLDERKTVLLKDAPEERLFSVLRTL